MTEQNESRKTTVNSWNEWDPLKHIIVGRAEGTMVQAPEPAMERDWPDHGFPLGTYGPLPKELLTVGNEILEATMSQRARWYEYLCYRPLLERYFKEDPNFRWEAAPKPRHDYAQWSVFADPDTMGPEDRPNMSPGSAGIPDGAKNTVLLLPFNENAFQLIEEHAHELAGVMEARS